MGTKLYPGKFDCYSKLEDDEPFFVLRSTDPHAPAIVELWATLRGAYVPTGVDADKIKEARTCAVQMRAWRRRWVQRQQTPPRRHKKP